MSRGAYSRSRVETLRKEQIARQRQCEITAGEADDIGRRASEFLEARGLANQEEEAPNAFRRIVVSVVVLRTKEEDRTWTRREAEAGEAKSMRAAIIREAVMAGRRAGLIRDGYQPQAGMKMFDPSRSPLGDNLE